MIIKAFFFFLLGSIFGSFLGCLSYRLYYKIPLTKRSFCPHCRKKILYRDLLPLLSYIWLKGKCRFCQKKINSRYFLIELFAGILFVLIFWHYQTINLLLIRDLFFCLVLFFILIFDWQYYLILDKIIWPALIIALLMNLLAGYTWQDLVLGMVIGAGFFLWQYLISQGKWLGLGDIKLGLLIGAMFGWQLTIVIIILAYIIGGLAALVSLLAKWKKFGDVMPMGTFLATAAIITLLCL